MAGHDASDEVARVLGVGRDLTHAEALCLASNLIACLDWEQPNDKAAQKLLRAQARRLDGGRLAWNEDR
jgi:hypothetical protein